MSGLFSCLNHNVAALDRKYKNVHDEDFGAFQKLFEGEATGHNVITLLTDTF